MAEPQSIVLNKRNGGMSNDEYAGGSFFYGENIDIRSNSKSFKLSKYINPYRLNNRGSGYHIKIVNYLDNILGVTYDGYVEDYTKHYMFAARGADKGGYLYNKGSSGFLNAELVNNYLFLAKSDKLDVLKLGVDEYGYGIWGSELVSTPDLTSATGWTTSGGWTFGTNGATHTTGTNTLSQTVTPGVGTGRINIYISGWTAGTLALSYGGTSVFNLSAQSPRWITYDVTTSASDAIVFTPSSDFNGTIGYVNVVKYGTANIKKDITLISSTNKPILAVGDFVYIGGGNKLEYVDTTVTFASLDAEDALVLQPGDEIVGLTHIGDVINIYCNNGQDGIKYIWNRVDENPSEKIIRKNKKFISVDGDGNQDYAIVGTNYTKYLYVTNGYQKQLLYKSLYMDEPNSNIEYYKLKNKFSFDKVIGFDGDLVYLGGPFGIYTYGTNYPGFPLSIVKEFSDRGTTYIKRAYSMTTRAGRVWFSYQNSDDDDNYFGFIGASSYNDSGCLWSNPIVFDGLGTEKLLRKLRIGYLSGGSNGTINIYLRANDNAYYTFYVSGLSVTPTAGAIYEYATMDLEVIKTNITGGAGTISCIATAFNTYNMPSGGTITKASGTGDASITYTDIDNFILIKTIDNTEQKYANEYVLGEDFIGIKLPDVIYKLQLKIELLTSSPSFSPEIFDIPILSDIVENEF